MKKALKILSSAAVALAALTSCAKEQHIENVLPAGEAIQVSINGLIGELTPADATKATAGSVVRVTWETGDEVYVYDGTARIGTLTVTPDTKNASYALLSGTITASTASTAPTKLTLVYVKGATEAPTIAGGKISIPLSTQDKADVPFVLYSTIDYDKDALTKTNEYISFFFATSVMTVNCTGLQTGEGNAITKAEIDGVSTICELSVTGDGVTVAGASKGTITRSETATPSVFTQSDSRGSFRLAIAADPAAPAARNILVHQVSKVSGAPFTSATLAGGQSYNTVYQLSEYKSDGAGGYAPVVKVTGVTLAKDKTTILVGYKETLEATVAPDNATNKQVKWSSSDTNIATVDDNGEVTGVAAGSAVITATTTDGNFKAFCLVTVTPVPVSKVTLDQTKLTLYVGSSGVKLTATITPTDATNKNVTWSSSNTAVATVDNDGKVTAVAAGTATIAVTTEDGNFKDLCVVTVKQLPKGALFGEFSVGDNKKVYFSQGNLWANTSGSTPIYDFEANQYDYQSSRVASHVSHFYWSKDERVAYDLGACDDANKKYNITPTTNDIFFTNKDATKANPEFTVNGEKGKYRTLSKDEWQYLLNYGDNTNNVRKDKYNVCVTVCGKKFCVVLLPDNWDTSIISLDNFADKMEYNETTNPKWSEMEAAGAVCLPAAGLRYSTAIDNCETTGYYWSTYASDDTYAYHVKFDEELYTPKNSLLFRRNAASVRLVTDVPAE